MKEEQAMTGKTQSINKKNEQVNSDCAPSGRYTKDWIGIVALTGSSKRTPGQYTPYPDHEGEPKLRHVKAHVAGERRKQKQEMIKVNTEGNEHFWITKTRSRHGESKKSRMLGEEARFAMRFHEEGDGLNVVQNLGDSKQGKNMSTTETSVIWEHIAV